VRPKTAVRWNTSLTLVNRILPRGHRSDGGRLKPFPCLWHFFSQ
jgi:hypothetical protein